MEVEYKGKKLPFLKYSEIEQQAMILDKKALAWIDKKPRKVDFNHPWR